MNRSDSNYRNPKPPSKLSPQRSARQSAALSPGGKLVGSNRDWILFLLFCVAAVILVARLSYLQVFAADGYAETAALQRNHEEPILAKRGTIYDRAGNVLAMSVDTMNIYANQDAVADKSKAATILAEILDGDYEEYYTLLTTPQTYEDPETGEIRQTDFVYLHMKVDMDIITVLKKKDGGMRSALHAKELALDPYAAVPETSLQGIGYEPSIKRIYPYGSTGIQVIGALDAEGKGSYGLEAMYDSLLRGEDGMLSTEYSAQTPDRPLSNKPIPGSERVERAPINGQDIVITLDIELQQCVESELARVGKERETNVGNAILLDGATGEIYATASLPLANREELTDEDVANGAITLSSICFSYEPGSIFKATTAAAVLEERTMQPDDELFVPATLMRSGITFDDSHPRPAQTMSFRTVIAESSNVGTTLIKETISNETFAAYLEKWGFGQTPVLDFPVGHELYGLGQTTHVDFPGENKGSLAPWGDWPDIQAANISFGQGVQVSPLQMASFYGVIANDGIKYQPHFLLDRPQAQERPTYAAETVMSSKTAEDMTSILTSVVSDGTGHAARIEGYTVAGKTGTAQKSAGPDDPSWKIEPGSNYLRDEYIVSFVGFLPNADTKLVCLASMDNPIGADGNAPTGPLFASIMKFVTNRYMIQPDMF